MKTISTQSYLDEKLVQKKLENDDFEAFYVTLKLDGTSYRYVVDGHHSIAAAKLAGEKVEWTRHKAMQIEANHLGGDDFILAHWGGDDIFDIDTGRLLL